MSTSSTNLNLNDMKKLGKIKLNQFSKDELELRELNALKGGCECARCGTCSCYYIFPETGGFDHHVDSRDKFAY